VVLSKLPRSVLIIFANIRESRGDIKNPQNKSMENSRLRMNNEVESNVLRNGGCYVAYPCRHKSHDHFVG
jgi:hypothetical protein